MHPTYETTKKTDENKMKKRNPTTRHPYIECQGNIVKGLYTCFKEKVENEWHFSGERHNFWEMVYVTEGHIYISVEKKTHKLQKGEIVFYMPMQFHQMWCEGCHHAKFTVISFGGDDEFLTPLGENIIKSSTEINEEIAQIYRFINDTFDVNLHVSPKNDSERNVIAERLCLNKFEHLLLSLLNVNKSDQQSHQSKGNANYRLIIDTMIENINRNLTIEELASLCNLSVSNLKKTFKKYGNESVMKYFNQLKINRAIRFLRDGYTAAQIAEEMGFSSQNYFSVVFKRETGMLPSEFKKRKL